MYGSARRGHARSWRSRLGPVGLGGAGCFEFGQAVTECRVGVRKVPVRYGGRFDVGLVVVR